MTAPEWLARDARPFVLSYVANPGAREDIAATLAQRLILSADIESQSIDNSSFGVQNQEDCDDNRLNAQDICMEVQRKVE